MEHKVMNVVLDQVVNKPEIVTTELKDDGSIPNSRFPLVIYRAAVNLSAQDPALVLERLFGAHGWRGCWRNGIYPYHHYHSTAHEVLGVYQGSAKVQFGGDKGIVHEIHCGDVVIIPAGVAHKSLGAKANFGVVGAYPDGQTADMNYGGPVERPEADQNIARVSTPKLDPVFGSEGPLLRLWGS